MIRMIMCFAIPLLLLAPAAAEMADSGATGKVMTLEVDVPLPKVDEYRIVDHEEGIRIEADGLGFLSIPGAPMLPTLRVFVDLPAGARIQSYEMLGRSPAVLPGAFSILPAPRILPACRSADSETALERAAAEWDRNHSAAYGSDDVFPAVAGRLVAAGELKRSPYVTFEFCPFMYQPLSGRLACYRSGRIVIRHTLPAGGSASKPGTDTLPKGHTAGEKASPLIIDSRGVTSISPPFTGAVAGPLKAASPQQPVYDYVIITEAGLKPAVEASTFLAWKRSLGFRIRIVLISDPAIAFQPGVDLEERIRSFLRSRYAEWGIRYVLMVGEFRTVPMRFCYPDRTNHSPGPYEIPTDAYYADLSFPDDVSWDADGDGYHGEYNQDFPDFAPEVYVGRIPVDDAAGITYALDKIVRFEQDTGAWKKNALHAGAFIYFTNEENMGIPCMDGAKLPNEIETQLMGGWTLSRYSEQSGLETSIYPWTPLTFAAFESDWKNGRYGVVNWFGHGANIGDGSVRKIWDWDDGDSIPEAHEFDYKLFVHTSSDLDDDYPSIVFNISCYVTAPELTPMGQLAVKLLTKPAFGASAGIVGTSRWSFMDAYWPSSPNGVEEIGFQFNRMLISDGKPVGEALYEAKLYCHLNSGWNFLEEYYNMYTMALYGDPSLLLAGAP